MICGVVGEEPHGSLDNGRTETEEVVNDQLLEGWRALSLCCK